MRLMTWRALSISPYGVVGAPGRAVGAARGGVVPGAARHTGRHRAAVLHGEPRVLPSDQPQDLHARRQGHHINTPPLCSLNVSTFRGVRCVVWFQ
jgi:hypothetical protein